MSDTRIENVKIGLVLAVEDSDLNLAKTCFDLLWKQEREYLCWRIPAMLTQQTVHLAGELALAMQKLEHLSGDSDREDVWRRLYYQMVITGLSKDAAGLYHLGKLQRASWSKHREFKLALDASKIAPEKTARTFLSSFEAGSEGPEFKERTKYEEAAVRELHVRACKQGLMSERFAMVNAIMLIGLRGLPEQTIIKRLREETKTALERLNGEPKTIELVTFSKWIPPAVKVTLPEKGKIKIWENRWWPEYVQTLEELEL